jgi:hypothetical protein
MVTQWKSVFSKSLSLYAEVSEVELGSSIRVSSAGKGPKSELRDFATIALNDAPPMPLICCEVEEAAGPSAFRASFQAGQATA